MKLLSRFIPKARFELMLLIFCVFSLIVFIWLNRFEQIYTTTFITLSTLEIILPLVLGIISAGLLANDPILDLILSMPQKAAITLFKRLVILLVIGVFLSMVLNFWANLWNIQIPKNETEQFLIWLVPMIFYIGLGSLGSLIMGRMLDGVILVIGVSGISLVSIPFIIPLCNAVPKTQSCLAAAINPAITMIRPYDLGWFQNRLSYGIAGVIFIILSFLFTTGEEHLIQPVQAE